ncbi:MAG: hypothetical protein F4Z86_03000 [Gemmatimonadetes bacterium]|nr:hypothetical protein [Gemmatimonadota bacterium]MYB58270.1 hypothetical protein [Gemmatimonadota bacterium]
MNTYRRRLVVQDPKQIVLSDVPFQTGQEVEIILRSIEQPTVERKNELRALLKKTQSLPQIQTLTEEDILAEIEAYRNFSYQPTAAR